MIIQKRTDPYWMTNPWNIKSIKPNYKNELMHHCYVGDRLVNNKNDDIEQYNDDNDEGYENENKNIDHSSANEGDNNNDDI